MKSNSFSGFEHVTHWIGVIEDRIDPLGMGRCKVRVFGYHNEDKNVLSTDDLPWSHSCFSLNNSKTFCSPSVGDWVLGIYLDGNIGQYGIILGVLPGLKNE